MTFKELKMTEPILKALNEKGHTVPTPIQQKAVLPASDNRDILGLAQTGTGKTGNYSQTVFGNIYIHIF